MMDGGVKIMKKRVQSALMKTAGIWACVAWAVTGKSDDWIIMVGITLLVISWYAKPDQG